jgi:uncharacterized protein YndB with AHSA1/START domain
VPKEVKSDQDQGAQSADRALVMTRLFDAPRELVFDAFTNPDRLVSWWGPNGCTVISCDADSRVGGAWRISMRSPKGIVERQRGVYQEVVRPERLAFTYAFEDDAGQPGHQTLVTLTFADERGKTRLTLQQATFDTVLNRDDHVRGWTEALDHLAAYIARGGN